MIKIVSDKCLEYTAGGRPACASAIDEVLSDVADLGDVEVLGEYRTIGKKEADSTSRRYGEGIFQLGDGDHGRDFSFQIIVFRISCRGQ